MSETRYCGCQECPLPDGLPSEGSVLLPRAKEWARVWDVPPGAGVSVVPPGVADKPGRGESVLEEAERLVNGPRQATYGHPLDDFSKTAKIWSAILGIEVTPEQVALCMVGVKISRECNAHKRDNIVDMAGYAGTLELIEAERKRRASCPKDTADTVSSKISSGASSPCVYAPPGSSHNTGPCCPPNSSPRDTTFCVGPFWFIMTPLDGPPPTAKLWSAYERTNAPTS